MVQHAQVADNVQDGVEGSEMVVRGHERLYVGHELHPGYVMTVTAADVEDTEAGGESNAVAWIHDKVFSWAKKLSINMQLL